MEYTETVSSIFKQLEIINARLNAINPTVAGIPRDIAAVHKSVDATYAAVLSLESLMQTISTQITALGLQLDAMQQASKPTVDVSVHRCRSCGCETDNDKADRYRQKITRLIKRSGSLLDDSQRWFVDGVASYIAENHRISKRQCEAVDRIIGEMS